MLPVITITVIAIVTLLLAVLAEDLNIAPGPKQTHLFESEDGKKVNPFNDLSDGAEDSATRCRDCGDRIDVETYRHCGSCAETPPADD